jgi:DNA processing protein
MSADPWAPVAAAGTDPALLAEVVAALRADEAGTRRRLADAVESGVDPGVAVRRAVGRRLPGIDGGAGTDARAWSAAGVRVALPGDPGYPARAVHVPDPPPLVAMRGDAGPLRVGPVVALVGARAATAYGRGVAAWLAEAAAEAGVHVLSGGAVGIDGAAHGAATDRPGRTSVVLGCGHDVRYPRPHAAPGGLFDRVVSGGGAILSECLPGTPPRAGRVRARNRLVAGLADVVVVVEGGPRSGSLITATAAGERGVHVMAVPGDVRAPGSAAPHRLLLEGASPCTDPGDLLEAVGQRPTQPSPSAPWDERRPDPADGPPSVLPAAVRAALVHAWPRPVGLETLARDAGVPTGTLLAALTRARVAGEVAQGPAGAVLRRAPRGSPVRDDDGVPR